METDLTMEDPDQERRRQLVETVRVLEGFEPRTVPEAVFQNRLLRIAWDLDHPMLGELGDGTLSAELRWTLLRFAPALLRHDPPPEGSAASPLDEEERRGRATLEEVQQLVKSFEPPGEAAQDWVLMLDLMLEGVEIALSRGGPGAVRDSKKLLEAALAYLGAAEASS